MRRGIAESEISSRHELGAMLPGIYQGDGFLQRFTAGLDAVSAPVVCTLDSLSAYFDPRTAPEDFLDYVAGWLGVELGQSWSEARRRRAVLHAARLYGWRGTARGVRAAVALALDTSDEMLDDDSAPAVDAVRVHLIETGAARWSQEPGAELPGSEQPHLVVRVVGADLSALDVRRLDALVAAAKPAHVSHRVELSDQRQRPSVGDATASTNPPPSG